MSQSLIFDFTLKALFLVLILSMPSILLATLTGLLVSLLQALTQIQEQTLGFAVKLVVVVLTLVLSANWVAGQLLSYADYIFNQFPSLVK